MGELMQKAPGRSPFRQADQQPVGVGNGRPGLPGQWLDGGRIEQAHFRPDRIDHGLGGQWLMSGGFQDYLAWGDAEWAEARERIRARNEADKALRG